MSILLECDLNLVAFDLVDELFLQVFQLLINKFLFMSLLQESVLRSRNWLAKSFLILDAQNYC